MSTQIEDAVQSGERNEIGAAAVAPRRAAALPRPPMLWLIVPVLLLALLAFLSRS